ncbi:cold adaptation protein AtcA [Moritella viscosa]|uniref:Uncharacterized protein n=1 Tax=Moritella viscosa TaxID=80854 RepID=A0A1L0BUE8_9GAMM|nr:hypothetical protein [Moritella viscosa]SGY96406.1 Putative uncharacterized protein [Moritella viscosa]SGZ02537.1 Putative uncharacterized protein [Moritella viscosa]SGZ08969.1 Putative uncharacterized protein [Moritella viscosa]SGZ09064.1 Putative uncharacterized protein [Moritella viscosa]SGZ10175.1 Putative uncharacterized protein [Moritella viscosa]
MTTAIDFERIEQLKEDAYSNIESYNDPDTPNALEQFTSQMKAVLLADPKLLASVPEYLPIALYDKVKFPPEAKIKWAQWIKEGILPEWNEFKTTVAFNNSDIPLVLAARGHSETLLIESCIVLFLLSNENLSTPASQDHNDYHEDEEEGYYNQFDEEEEEQ